MLVADKRCPYGFSVRTAYPLIDHMSADPTGRDISEVMRHTICYRDASPVHRAYMEYQADGMFDYLAMFKAGKTPDDDMLIIEIPTSVPEVSHRIQIKENRLMLFTMSKADGTARKVPSVFTDECNGNKQYGNPLNVNLTKRKAHSMFRRMYPEASVMADTLFNLVQGSAGLDPCPVTAYPATPEQKRARKSIYRLDGTENFQNGHAYMKPSVHDGFG